MTLSAAQRTELVRAARAIRRSLLEMIHAVQTGHLGSSLSMIEILAYLYLHWLRIDSRRPRDPARDRFVLSKGHGAPGLYATLAHAGFFAHAELATLRQLGSRLHGHPVAGELPGIEQSTGSLGQGLSVSAGLALGLRLQQQPCRVVCLVGDGEMQEGQNWEAIAAASAFRLSNLCCIVDRNQLQNDGPTEHIMPLGDLVGRFAAFGWRAVRIDGHDFDALDAALGEAAGADRPLAIVAETVKGKGVSFMEGQVQWHHHPIDDDQLAQALAELGGDA
jgi:transketolase